MAKFAQLCAGERKVRRIGRTDRQMDRWSEQEKNKEREQEEHSEQEEEKQ